MTFVTRTFVQFIQSPPIGAALTREEKEAIQSLNITPKRYPPHTLVTRQGDVEPRISFVNSGWGCIYRDLASGDRQIIDFPIRGDIIGIRSEEGQSYNSYASRTELSVFEVSAESFYGVLNSLPRLSSFFVRTVARQRAMIIEHLTNIGRRNALVRTAHYLLELDARLATFGETSERGYECPLTQQELADLLGLTAIHVNRTLRELREHQLVSFRSGYVEFLNKQRLVKLSGFDPGYLSIRNMQKG
jgi:CRP-like cAMP-binding protein